MNLSEIMKSSKESLEGKWGLAIGTIIVYILISLSVQALGTKYQGLSLLSLVITGPYALGLAFFSLNIATGQEARFEDSFYGFSKFGKSLVAYLLILLFVIGGLILLIVPGIIVAMALSMTYFILAEDEDISAIDAMKKSHEMMNGYKMDYFILQLIYLGMALICAVLTLGIGFFWLVPYIQVTNAKFYEKVKENTPDAYIVS